MLDESLIQTVAALKRLNELVGVFELVDPLIIIPEADRLPRMRNVPPGTNTMSGFEPQSLPLRTL